MIGTMEELDELVASDNRAPAFRHWLLEDVTMFCSAVWHELERVNDCAETNCRPALAPRTTADSLKSMMRGEEECIVVPRHD
jgi:hypothetical protein